MKIKLIISCVILFFCIGVLNAQSSDNKGSDNNLIEISLLEQYENIQFDKINSCYYIYDSIGNAGIANANGEVLVSPMNGKMAISVSRNWDWYFMFGDETGEFERPVEFSTNANNIIIGNIAITQGLFKTVVKRDSSHDEMNVIIQYDKYDYISIVLIANNFTSIEGFCVGRLDENNNVLWGFCDEDGNEIIPCEYTGIFYDGETFTGDNTKEKFEWNDNAFYAEYVNNDSDFTSNDTETRIYKVGDYYDEDGKQGVVFEVSKDGRHGKIVSLDYTKTQWNAHKVKGCDYKGNSWTGASDLNNGKKNTDKVLAREDSQLYLAFLWCREKGSDWYLPSQNELRKIFELKDILNETIEMEGGNVLSGVHHFSSTEYPYATEKMVSTLNYAAVVTMNNGLHFKGDKNDTFKVRAVATF